MFCRRSYLRCNPKLCRLFTCRVHIAGLGNAIGLLRNIQLGALQYQAAIAQIINGGSIEQSSLSGVHTQIEKQRFAGILLFGYCIEGQSCAVADMCMYVLLWRHATKHLVPKLLVKSRPCLASSLQKMLPRDVDCSR